LYSKILF